MRIDEDRVESGLTILEQPADGEAFGLTLGDAPPEAAAATTSGEAELEAAERLLVGNGKEANYYAFFGLSNFQELSESDSQRVAEVKDRTVALAEREWGGNERTEGRFNELNKALSKAFTRITQQKPSFDRDLRRLLVDRLDTIVEQYLKSNAIGSASLEVDEYRSIMEGYEANGVLSASRPDEIAAFRAEVAKLVAARGGSIIDLEREFVESLGDLRQRDFVDTEENRARVAERYAELKESEWYSRSLERRGFSAAEVMPELEAALGRAGLGFKPKAEVFESEVFAPFASRLGVSGGGQIDSFNYGQLLLKAREEYFFSDAELQSFCDARGVTVKAEVELKFNFGFTADRSRKLEAKSYEEIVALFEEFPDKAALKLYDGDLEVYLDNLGNTELRDKVRAVCSDYPGEEDRKAGLRKTVYTLLPSRPYRAPDGTECRGLEELGDAIEGDLDGFRNLLLFERNNEVLLFLEARDALEAAHELRAWVASGKSQDKRLNGIVWVLQGKVFKREGKRFISPEQVVRLGDEKLRARLAAELADEDSKFAVWIEGSFPALVKDVERWRKLGRHNEATITYALEPKHPFHYGELRAYNPADFVEAILKAHAKDKDFLGSFLDPKSALRAEAEFWLREYQSTDGVAALRGYLRLVAADASFKQASDRVLSSLSASYAEGKARSCWDDLLPLAEELLAKGGVSEPAYAEFRGSLVKLLARDSGEEMDQIVQRYLEKRIGDASADKRLILELFKYFQRPSTDRGFYEKKVQPLLEKAVAAGVIPEEARASQKKYFLAKYEQGIAAESYEGKIATIAAMKSLDPEHPLVRLYEESDESMRSCVRATNAARRTKNALKRDVIAALAFASTLGISFIPSLSKSLKWAPATINEQTVGTIIFWALIIGVPATLIAIKKARS
jgi:hypothetical protein